MKATEQYFPVVQFIMLYKLVPTFASVDEVKVFGNYFPVVLFFCAISSET